MANAAARTGSFFTRCSTWLPRPLHLFSSDQLRQADADAGGRGLDFRDLLETECERRFGFGYAGPAYEASGQRSGRHEVHVGYALAAARDVPADVLAEYSEQPFGSDMQWAKVLLDVPELRGAVPLAKLRPSVSSCFGKPVRRFRPTMRRYSQW